MLTSFGWNQVTRFLTDGEALQLAVVNKRLSKFLAWIAANIKDGLIDRLPHVLAVAA